MVEVREHLIEQIITEELHKGPFSSLQKAWQSKSSSIAQRNDLCCICLEEFPAEVICMVTPCEHVMHATCMVNWLRASLVVK
jgi:hypothetical protein